MPKGPGLRITAAAAAELGRQAAVAGTPGLMHLDLIEGGCEQWTIRLRPGHLAGTPVARADGTPFRWQDQTGARICLAARRHGLLTRPIRDTLVLMPPLCFTGRELERSVDALRRGIREVCGGH